METVLEVQELSKFFGKICALKRVSFSLFSGEILGIIGPNGAGKTTLINCLLGLVSPTSGKILYFGKDFFKNRSWILSRINFASNYVALPLSLTVEENLLVYAYLYGIKKPQDQVAEMLRIFELHEKRKKRTRTLSSGQMMRLCLAKAFLNSPRILLLDEPTAGLDPEIAQKTHRLISSYARQKEMAVLFTSHNLTEVERISDRILILQNGKVKALGKVPELLKEFGSQSLEELYFGLIS